MEVTIIEVGGDIYKVSTENVLKTFGAKIEQFLDETFESKNSTAVKYVITRPKEPMVLQHRCATHAHECL